MAVSVETLSAEAVTTLSACKHEPTWMRDRRLAAWRQSQELSLPLGTEEEWRRTDLRGLELEHYLRGAVRVLQATHRFARDTCRWSGGASRWLSALADVG